MIQTLELAISHYQLIVSEHELLTQTLTGSMLVLTDILSIVNPSAFGGAAIIRRLASQIAQKMKVRNAWECEIAAMLSMIGTIAVPNEVLKKVEQKVPLNQAEQDTFSRHPTIGESLIGHIPRLKNAAQCIKYQNKNYNGTGFPLDQVQGDDIPIGARILRVVMAYDSALEQGELPERAFAMIQDDENSYDLQVVAALEEVVKLKTRFVVKEVTMKTWPNDCILAQDIVTRDGTLLVHSGQEVNESMKIRLFHHAKTVGIQEPIKVMVAVTTTATVTT